MTHIQASASSAAKPQTDYTTKLAQAAGSLSALALMPMGAQAAVVHHTTPIGPVSVGVTSTAYWDVDGNGSSEFFLWSKKGREVNMDSFDSHGSAFSTQLNGRGLVQTAGMSTNDDLFQKLSLGFKIGSTLAANYNWGHSGQTSRTIVTNFSSPGSTTVASDAWPGGFRGGSGQFFGFKFTDGGDLFYGWAALDINLGTGSVAVTEWAYNDLADAAICVGETSGPGGVACSSSVPEPSAASLILLGLGLGGLRAFRARKQASALNA